MSIRLSRSQGAFVGLLALLAPLGIGAAPYRAAGHQGLPLGSGDLPETRTVQQVAPGVSLTTIVRGRVLAADHWTVDVAVPTGVVPPTLDPDTPQSVLGSRANAEAIAARLTAAGYAPTVSEQDSPAFQGFGGGPQGYVVRVGAFADQPSATALAGTLAALGYTTSTVYTGMDNTQTDGPWVLHELVIDPHEFKGSVEESHGATMTGRRTTTQLATAAGALAAVNGGFFVINPADGTPGESAGMVVENGKVLRESTDGRITAILRDGGRNVQFAKLTTHLTVSVGGTRHAIQGLNRPAGLIRDCGHPGDRPTSRPLMDVTCTNPNESVMLTPEFGAAPPAGPGEQAVVDANGQVLSIGPRDGAAVPPGASVLQSIGTEAGWLSSTVKVGQQVALHTKVTDEHGSPVIFGPHDSVINGGPQLLGNGHESIDPVADGVAHPGDPSYFYGWGIRRNPRTVIGKDRQGRVVLLEADGREPGYSQGLTLEEEAKTLRSLGVVAAMNLDGGGSSAMYVAGGLVSRPSDATGERPVGDAVVVVPATPAERR
ncbi:phosphodiester glycosidase family protein [Kitasatospora kifunensis]|uniref:Exopolysaccharide biosynthesis protein n=1 Tax=Kitasatospora kifunensis TaxID=58351 RepID=A0A7W7RA48_KITKI|nr:phosphodiester glycosidase family protein [Kitasatospora kifunensis]MBB4927893.1 exopolysaccharide biosynthesis protein [Kitasatospora kifunensis]